MDTNEVKKNLIVTLADANFIDQAKQLFASVYFNSGWSGDYLLLASNICEADLAWFKAKGILIYECELLTESLPGLKPYSPIILSKIYLFKEYFKKWQKIVFLDSDIIVQASLDSLLQLSGFNAPKAVSFCLKDEFVNSEKTQQGLINFNLNKEAFNTGIFCFDSDLIEENTFNDLMILLGQIKDLCLYGDESLLNIFFYQKYKMLPITYNSVPGFMNYFYGIKSQKILAHIVHFSCYEFKPWHEKNEYHKEWINNLKKAENINLAKRPVAARVISQIDINCYCSILSLRRLIKVIYFKILSADRKIGRLGIFIKTNILRNGYKK